MEQGTIDAKAENVLPLIRKYLYAHREVFLRELVSNSVDAFDKLKVIARNGSLPKSDIGELRIDIRVDRASSTIQVKDNGIGMTYDDVKKYICQIAVSGAADFLQQYEAAENMIGCFGIGFYSVFLVASAVTIETKSHIASEQGCKWKNEGGVAYEMSHYERSDRGTEVVLQIEPEQGEFLDPDRIRGIVRKYCDFLPYPIYVDGQLANSVDAPWHKPRGSLPARAYRDFHQRLFEGANESRFWVHLETDFPVVLRGILYVPYTPDEEGQIRLFCSRIFVDEHFGEAVPPFLGFLRGVLDAEGLPLNLPREKVQDHKVIRAIQSFVVRKVAEEFAEIAQKRREDFSEMWTDYERVLKIGALEDDHWFALLYQYFLFPSSRGRYTTLAEYLERNRQNHAGVIYYLTNPSTQRAYLEEFRLQNKEVVYFARKLDLLLLNRARALTPALADFRRVDIGSQPSPPPQQPKSEDIAHHEAFAAMFSALSPWPSVMVSAVEAVDFPVLIRRKDDDVHKADLDDLLHQFKKEEASRSPEHWLVILNSRHPLIQDLLRIHKNNRHDPLLIKTCELLSRQTAMKFGLADEDDTATFLNQTEDLLTWVCRQHAASAEGNSNIGRQ